MILDVSLITPNSGGSLAYAVASDFAHNTGRIFIGDPAGLSDVALRRRTEQMISSALKFGTTRHLGPHPRQVTGDSKLGVPPLKWDYADTEGNFERMVDVSVKSMENAFPASKVIGYRNGTFYRTDTNQRFRDRDQLARLVDASIRERRKTDGGVERTGQAGWRTVARNALFRNLQEAHNADGGRGRGSLLDRARKEFTRLRSDPDSSGAIAPEGRIFYSRTPFESKQSAVIASLKEPGTRAVQDDDGSWLLAPRERPYTEQEKADAQQRVTALNRVLLRYAVAPAQVLLDAPTGAMAWGRSVARTLGFDVTFIRPNRDFSGVALGGQAFVGPSAEHPEIGLIGHEVLHSFKQTDPQAYQALAEQIRPYLKGGVVEAKRKWEDARGGKNTTVAIAEEEVIADLNGSMWLDPKFWRDMARNDPN